MNEEKFSFYWIVVTVLFLILFSLFGKAWETEESKFIFYLFIGLLIITVSYYLYDRKNKITKQDIEISKKLMDAREEEKSKIASDLHDSIQQDLHSINFELQQIANRSPFVSKEVNRISDRIIEAIENVRSISANLYPYIINKLGLKKAIEAMANDLTDSSPIYFETEINENINNALSKDNSIHVYRIIQELCNNIVKHSKATNANIEIYSDDRYLYLNAKDDGKGFAANPSDSAEGIGINSIRERVKLLKGKFIFDSSHKGGTLFKLTVPINKI